MDPMVLQQQREQMMQNIQTGSQILTYDYTSDASYQRFLDPEHPFTQKDYIPEDLVAINSDFTFNNARQFQLRKEAAEQFADMVWHFQNDHKGKKKISLTSAYRSYKLQTWLSSKCNPHHCAAPGTSEHQAGLAVDIGINGRRLDKNSAHWLQNNAHKWGFHQTYQKGVEVDGKIVEPRHWRYVGTGLATELFEKKMTLKEWFLEQEKLEKSYDKCILKSC